MKHRVSWIVLLAGFAPFGCELIIIGGAITTAAEMTYSSLAGEGVKVYNIPYRRVVPAAEAAGARLGLYELNVEAGERKALIEGKNIDDEAVRIRVLRESEGRKAAVRVRVGPMGDYLYTTLVFDAINEGLGLPPESHSFHK